MPTEVKQKFVSLYDTLVQEGIEKGIEKGKEKEIITVILRGHKEGLSLKTLSAITGLTEKEVEAILKKKSRKKKA